MTTTEGNLLWMEYPQLLYRIYWICRIRSSWGIEPHLLCCIRDLASISLGRRHGAGGAWRLAGLRLLFFARERMALHQGQGSLIHRQVRHLGFPSAFGRSHNHMAFAANSFCPGVLRDWAFVALGGVGSGVSNIQTNKPPADCAFRVVEEREVMEVACSIACLLSAIQTSKLFIQTNRHCFQCR